MQLGFLNLDIIKQREININRGLFRTKKNVLLRLQLILFLSILMALESQAQRKVFDTLEVADEYTFVHYKTFDEGTLIEESQAYLFPITRKLPRYRWLVGLLKTKIHMDSVVRHGETRRIEKNGDYSVMNYNYGQKLDSNYFDFAGDPLSIDEFNTRHLKLGPCGIITGEYIIHPKKKGKRNKK